MSEKNPVPSAGLAQRHPRAAGAGLCMRPIPLSWLDEYRLFEAIYWSVRDGAWIG